MNHWAFVWAAYGITALATAGILGHSWWSMRRAERAADALRRK
ncbi:heme exporter protein CcmD [Sphingomonas sp.]|nr:heme exporter protein CcmD [Sphingomonas sp.]HTG37393.1 heme exporter protein CcmD [Sphingomonas sp.]